MSYRPSMIIRATQKKRMSYPVSRTDVGYQYLRPGVCSGQPSVENGQSPDENHVSRTSGSCSSLAEPHFGQAVGSSTAANVSPLSQYQTGMRCPHQSWREMHQSRMFSIQCMYTRSKRRGMIWMRPSLTAAMGGSGNPPRGGGAPHTICAAH